LQPRYATLSSSGSTPWFPTDWWRNPINLGISVVSTGGANFQIDVTADDPTGEFPNLGLNPGAPAGTSGGGTVGGRVVSVLPSTACFGGGVPPNTTNTVGSVYGSILSPIAAWRLTVNNSSLGPVTASVLQGGPR
jgi:hypothetical protein